MPPDFWALRAAAEVFERAAADGMTFTPVTGLTRSADVAPALDDFFARQITSINSAVPVMVIVSPFQDHVGIINGGAYQYIGSTGTYTWNTVLLHDPGAGPNLEFNSADWKAFTCDSNFSYCGQVISNSASYYWSSNLASFGSSVELYDGTGGCCNQEYQN